MSLSRLVWIVPLLLLLLLSVVACEHEPDEPIRIGFIGGLTGRTAAVGIAARDGAILAVSEINRNGGINGRKVELIIKDIRQDGVAGIHAVEELVAEKIPAIIGPMTSTMALILAPVVNGTETLMLSPTASTMLLGEKDDNFFRLRPQCSVVAKKLADYVVDKRGLRRIAAIYDISNSVYTSNWKSCFVDRLEEKGGTLAGDVAFDSQGEHLFGELIRKALREQPEGVLILGNSLDTAMLTQQMMKQDTSIPVFASEWSMTRDLLISGGRSVEGMTMFHVFNEASREKRYLEFNKKYRERFRQKLSFPAVHAYDATQIVLSGLQQGARTGPELKTFLLQKDSFKTLQSTVGFDQYGDVKRELFLTIIKDGEFIVVQ